MTARRTVDITVDAHDAPMLAALAKRLEHIRALGHGDDYTWATPHGFEVLLDSLEHDASALKQLRDWQTKRSRADFLTVLMGEVAEVLEARTPRAKVYELLDVAAVCLRGAGKEQRDIDAREGST